MAVLQGRFDIICVRLEALVVAQRVAHPAARPPKKSKAATSVTGVARRPVAGRSRPYKRRNAGVRGQGHRDAREAAAGVVAATWSIEFQGFGSGFAPQSRVPA